MLDPRNAEASIVVSNQMDSFPSFLFEKNLEIFLKRSKLYIESFGGSA
ncbi:hypothetical protein HMPREF9422_0705 [Streptococcus cristatus ATCC 51100]|nr:hypothetical protein HMPREF9422_0705 [Streptococcus cristatus ATCC 51100]